MPRHHLAIALLSLVLIAVFNPTAAQNERVLRLALPEGDANSLDPHAYCCLSDAWVLANVYEGLVRYDPHTLQPVPALAESWDVSADGLVYTFHMRPNVTFHNGRAVSAFDAVYSLNRLVSATVHPIPDQSYAVPLIVGRVEGYDAALSGSAVTMTGAQALDAMTLQIRLTLPYPAFLSALTMIPAAIVPVEAADDGGTFFAHPVGTGPFSVEEWVRTDHITLVANPNYWGGAPALDRVLVRSIPETPAILPAFRTGEIDLTLVPPSELATVQADPALARHLQNQTLLSLFWLPLNLTYPPLDNLMVRQAMAQAIDRQAIIDSALFGQGVPAHGPFPPGLSAYVPDYNPLPYDPDRARQLLAEAGFPDGIDVEFRTWTDETELAVLRAVQEQWNAVGIRATFYTSDYTSYTSDLAMCRLQIAARPWTADFADPTNVILPLPLTDLSPMGAGCGYGQIPQTKELALQADTLPPGEERDELYRQAERAAVENVLGIFLFHRSATLLVSENVQGAYLDPYSNVLLYPISLTG